MTGCRCRPSCSAPSSCSSSCSSLPSGSAIPWPFFRSRRARRFRGLLLAAIAVLAFAGPGSADEKPREQGGGVQRADAFLEKLLGLGEISPSELSCLVEDAGGLRFRAPVPIDFLSYQELKAYLGEVVASEYPA